MYQKSSRSYAWSAKWRAGSAAACVLVALAGCGGGGGGSNPAPPPVASYTVGGAVNGLSATGLVLANGTDGVGVTAQTAGPTTFTFTIPVPSGSTYDVVVKTQPAGETCVVTNATGTVSNANVTNVTVTCGYTVGGTIYNLNSNGLVLTDGSQTVAPAAGATSFTFPQFVTSSYSVTVQTQPAGEICGVANGLGPTPPTGNYNLIGVPCAQANASSGSWLLEGTGSNAAVYGTKGVPAPGNRPGARTSAATWTDASGTLWLFGGQVFSPNGNGGSLGDLWKYDPGTQQWTWVGGPMTPNSAGVYGTRGTAAAANIPGARSGAITWTDVSGNVWLFGGGGYDSAGGQGSLNDLWKYDPKADQWTWMSGSMTANAAGVYGTLGVAAANNVPGARGEAVSWIDGSGNLWLFGGLYYDTKNYLYLNDLWKYTLNTGQWTWMSGSSGSQAQGVYGTQGVAAASNVPGARLSAASWIDASGNLWLFGGTGFASGSVTGNPFEGLLNDLWRYSPGTGLWTWMSGSTAAEIVVGIYGTQGVAAPGNVPGVRNPAGSWIDHSGNFWLFGGKGNDSFPPLPIGNQSGVLAHTALNDVWEYSPATGQWTWVNGFTVGGTDPTYGSPAVGSAGMPGALASGLVWADQAGNVWLLGNDTVQGTTVDLWKFVP